MKKFFILGLLPAVVLAAGVLYYSEQKYLADTRCGCGPPSPEETGEFEEDEKEAFFNNEPVSNYLAQKLIPPEQMLGLVQSQVLGEEAYEQRWIEIDLSDQKLYAHNGDKIDYEFLVSSGKWALTPTGEFRIWSKFRYTKMSGGSKALHTYYYLPNVPYTQYFTSTGVGLHGTYWHNNFGHPMSHGCVNLATPDAEKLFYWTSPVVTADKNSALPTKDQPGTRVIVHN